MKNIMSHTFCLTHFQPPGKVSSTKEFTKMTINYQWNLCKSPENCFYNKLHITHMNVQKYYCCPVLPSSCCWILKWSARTWKQINLHEICGWWSSDWRCKREARVMAKLTSPKAAYQFHHHPHHSHYHCHQQPSYVSENSQPMKNSTRRKKLTALLATIYQ